MGSNESKSGSHNLQKGPEKLNFQPAFPNATYFSPTTSERNQHFANLVFTWTPESEKNKFAKLRHVHPGPKRQPVLKMTLTLFDKSGAWNTNERVLDEYLMSGYMDTRQKWKNLKDSGYWVRI